LEQELRNHIAEILGKYDSLQSHETKWNIIRISAVTHEGIESLLDAWTDILTDPEMEHLSSFLIDKESLSSKHSKADPITNETEKLLPILIEQNYLNEWDEATIWTINDRDVSRLCFITARGNDEAELRYRKVMDKEGWLKRFEQAWIERWDILHIVSRYEEHKNRFIRFQ
jgi:hypothetical protein